MTKKLSKAAQAKLAEIERLTEAARGPAEGAFRPAPAGVKVRLSKALGELIAAGVVERVKVGRHTLTRISDRRSPGFLPRVKLGQWVRHRRWGVVIREDEPYSPWGSHGGGEIMQIDGVPHAFGELDAYVEHDARRHSNVRPASVTDAQVRQVIDSLSGRGDRAAPIIAKALGVPLPPAPPAPAWAGAPQAPRTPRPSPPPAQPDLFGPPPSAAASRTKPRPAAPPPAKKKAPPVPAKKAPPARKRSNMDMPSQNAIDQVSAALLEMQKANAKLARPWEYGLSEKAWRRLAVQIAEAGHKMMPIIGSCGDAVHLKDAQQAAKRAKRAMRGGAMPKRRRRRRS